jgi:hypothetical protein
MDKNYLKGKSVYLCGSIHASHDDGIGWRDVITPKLQKMGIQVLNPCKKTTSGIQDEIGEDKKFFKKMVMEEKWVEIKEKFWPIIRNDLRMVDKSDFIIFNYDTAVRTVGCIHELVIATFEKKVILLKFDKTQLSDFNPWITTFIKSHHFFAEWDEMFSHLNKVNSGDFDTSLWVI